MNATLTSLVNDVYALTNRPDLVGETLLAVRNATLKAHNIDYFYKDLLETGIQFDFSLAQQTFEYKSLIPRWRALKYLRKCALDIQGVAFPTEFLEVVTSDSLLDSYSLNKNNVCYVAGAQLQIRSSEAQQYFLLGCYIYPDVTELNYNSWVATEQSAAIVYQAAATIFKTIGYDEQNAAYAQLVKEEYAQLMMNNIQSVGY